MSTTKRKSFAKALSERADAVLQHGQPEESVPAQLQPISAPAAPVIPEAKPIEFKKFTVPIRSDQLDNLATTLAHLLIDHGVELSKAALIRYGLDLVLREAKDNPDRLLQALQAFEQEELSMNADRKYSVSAGLAEYKAKQ